MQLISTLKKELKSLESEKAAVAAKFSSDDYEDLRSRWTEKLQRAEAGEQLWAQVIAHKPMQ